VRRTIALTLLAAALLVGCGSSSSSHKQADPASAALSYFPAATPFVLTAATDPNSAAAKQSQSLEARLPVIGLARAAVMARLQAIGIDYQTDIRPLAGNPIAVGASTSTLTGAATKQFLIAWVTKSASKLKALITKLHFQASGSRDGAQLYQAGRLSIAVDGATVLLSADSGTIGAALDRHAHGGGLTPAAVASDRAGLPSNSAIEAFGSLTNVLSGSRSAKARRVPWVAAIRGYGVAVNSTSSGLTIQYHVDTTGGSLSSAQLPIASGSTPPSLAGDLPIQVAMRNPAQVIRFVQSAAQAVSPGSYGKYLVQLAKFKRKTGIDLNSLVGLLNGDLIIESDTHSTIGRAGISNPGAVAKAIRELTHAPKGVFDKATRFTPLGGGLYEVQTPRARLTVGVIANQLVVGKASPAAIRSFATAPTIPASGASGALAFKVALLELLHATLKHAPSPAAQAVLNLLGDVTGSSSADPSGLSGRATVALR
jgi:Protein of unknown function (DUF3352)